MQRLSGSLPRGVPVTAFRPGRPAFEIGNAPGSIQAMLDGEETADLLFELLADVVQRQHPEVAAALRGKPEPGEFLPESLSRVFQAHGIWFQLLSIVAAQHETVNALCATSELSLASRWVDGDGLVGRIEIGQ